jgi:polysaccharide export outer membrane protein
MFNRNILSRLVIAAALLIIVPFWSNLAVAQSPESTAGDHNGLDSPPYLIGPSDVLDIYVWKEPELTREAIVMPDGRITYPLIGQAMAQGATVAGLRDIITEKLAKYVTAPEVTVIVKQALSQRIYMIGQVNRPGPYPLEPNMTVLQALAAAGGFAEWADQKNVLIVRREGQKEVQIRFNYKTYITGKDLPQNILLKPNDTIVVP